jgi:hypothetical protein
METNMNRQQALQQDKDFYADQENDTWYVFGDNSGFAYKECANYEAANDAAVKMRFGRKEV